jgi:hypothetical protein
MSLSVQTQDQAVHSCVYDLSECKIKLRILKVFAQETLFKRRSFKAGYLRGGRDLFCDGCQAPH